MQLNSDGKVTLPGGKKLKGATAAWLKLCTPAPKVASKAAPKPKN